MVACKLSENKAQSKSITMLSMELLFIKSSFPGTGIPLFAGCLEITDKGVVTSDVKLAGQFQSLLLALFEIQQ